MNDGPPCYTFPIGNTGRGYWLIRQNPHDRAQWVLVMVGPHTTIIGSFGSPHEAAYAVARFQTGNPMWDSMPHSAFSFGAQQIGKSDLDVLKAWNRHDGPPPATEPIDEDEEDEEYE